MILVGLRWSVTLAKRSPDAAFYSVITVSAPGRLTHPTTHHSSLITVLPPEGSPIDGSVMEPHPPLEMRAILLVQLTGLQSVQRSRQIQRIALATRQRLKEVASTFTMS